MATPGSGRLPGPCGSGEKHTAPPVSVCPQAFDHQRPPGPPRPASQAQSCLVGPFTAGHHEPEGTEVVGGGPSLARRSWRTVEGVVNSVLTR